ncbi:Hypothetical predicted protein [Pelobates cultripes]|uniref:Uncharacterized protein n=1 Tax=Pelobates cultripes TaxID=61616 RepID=A0AAD1RZ81_PELCU|nr:Hypothetical predicted protein [Pelobates cultripes]
MSFQWTDVPAPYAFPTPSLLMKVLEKIRRDRVQSLVLVYPVWTSRPWYPLIHQLVKGTKIGGLLSGNQQSSAQAPATDVDRSPCRLLTHPLLSDQVLDIINSSLRRRTRVRYRKMIEEFKEWEISFLSNTQGSDTVPLALEFITLKFHSGLSVSSIKTYGSALNFLIPNLTQDALYLRLLIGLSICRPYTPRYTSTWDVDVLLNFLNSLDNAKIDLRWTAIKLAYLLSLALAARGAELTQIHISDPWLSRTPGGFHIILKGRQKNIPFFSWSGRIGLGPKSFRTRLMFSQFVTIVPSTFCCI